MRLFLFIVTMVVCISTVQAKESDNCADQKTEMKSVLQKLGFKFVAFTACRYEDPGIAYMVAMLRCDDYEHHETILRKVYIYEDNDVIDSKWVGACGGY
jgi:hypothetical protein